LDARRNVSTYSIVAIDRSSGEMGVAVQSHWFSVGSVVPWAEAGVGVVATQAFVEAAYGPRGLALMKKGKTPQEALNVLLSRDPSRAVRQVAMLDAMGRTAAHTGSKCLPEAGHVSGPGFSAQANLMSSDRVWRAMASAFQNSKGKLGFRLMASLEAGEAAGGDLRGRQSAAILVVSTKRQRASWLGRSIELRVEDHPRPLVELRRLLGINEAYLHANAGDELVAVGKMKKALAEYSLASKLAPEIEELSFWEAVALAEQGRVEESKPIFGRVFRKRRAWRRLLSALPAFGLLSVPEPVLHELTSL